MAKKSAKTAAKKPVKKHLFANPEPAKVAQAVLPDGHVWIDLMDGANVLERVSIPEREHGFSINHGGKVYEHVSDHADGTWQFRTA